jgi:hypothetical protein
MVYNRTFSQTKSEVHAFKNEGNSPREDAPSENSCAGACKDKKDPYHVVGKVWKKPLVGAPYANIAVEADRVWKMPGSRATMKDQIGGMCKKYWLVYNNLFKLALTAAGAFLCFFVLGGIALYIGIAFVIGMGCYYQAYKQHLETTYSLESNWGAILPIGAERDYLVKGKWSGMQHSGK